MTKSIAALATLILAATTMLTSAAEAGFRVHLGFGGLPPYMTDYNKEAAQERSRAARKHAYRAARRHETAPVHVAKKSSDSVAKVAETVETTPAKVAEIENSSISVAQVETAQTTPSEPVETAEATPSEPQVAHTVDCKKFFPTVGLTLSVPCE
jgi:hypothetical protein